MRRSLGFVTAVANSAGRQSVLRNMGGRTAVWRPSTSSLFSSSTTSRAPQPAPTPVYTEYTDNTGRVYYCNNATGDVTWDPPPEGAIIEVYSPDVPTDAAGEPKKHFLEGWGADGLPHLPDEPSRPKLPADASPFVKAFAWVHHTVVYSRSASLLAGLAVAVALAAVSYKEHMKQRKVKEAAEERRRLAELRRDGTELDNRRQGFARPDRR